MTQSPTRFYLFQVSFTGLSQSTEAETHCDFQILASQRKKWARNRWVAAESEMVSQEGKKKASKRGSGSKLGVRFKAPVLPVPWVLGPL